MLPATEELPKAMLPFRGTTLIGQGIEKIRPHVPHIHVTVGHHAGMLAEHVIEHGAATVINTSDQGNAWWIQHTLMALLNEPVLVLTCDNVTDLDIPLLEQEYNEHGSPPCMLVPVEPVDGLDGDYIFHDDHIVRRLSRTEVTSIYCSGIQIVNPFEVARLAPGCEDFNAVWAALMPGGHVRASRIYPRQWFSVDTPHHLQRLASDRDRR